MNRQLTPRFEAFSFEDRIQVIPLQPVSDHFAH